MSTQLRILALEPYYGGSHRAFLDGWAARSRHEFTLLGLPAHHWKWRMRHAPLTLAEQVARRVADGQSWNVVFCSDMLSLTEFRGLAPPSVARLPAVVYFHENQLTYPVQEKNAHDLHFAFTNFTTALAAEAVWFNSAFHRDDLLAALADFLPRMPDHQPVEHLTAIRAKSSVQPPGIEPINPGPPRQPGPLRIAWAARWEHDKNPEDFFAALDVLLADSVDFRVSVLGEQFRDVPPVFAQYRERLADRIDHWGFQPSRADYIAALQSADVFVSTANHEFFGIAAVEAMAAGCMPLLPNRLAYPELVTGDDGVLREEFLYDGSVGDLASRLVDFASSEGLAESSRQNAVNLAARFEWGERVHLLDDALGSIT